MNVRALCAGLAFLTTGTACDSTPGTGCSGLVCGSPGPIVTPAPIGTPAALGSNAADSVITGALSVTTAQTAPAGSSIIVIAADVSVFGTNNVPGVSATCSDSAGNSYATDVTESNPEAAITTICSAHGIPTALASGSSITVTWSGAVNMQYERAMAWSVTNLSIGAADRTATGIGIGSTASTGPTAVTTWPSELLFAAVLNELGTDSAAPGSNGTSNVCATSGTPTYTSLGSAGTSGAVLVGMYCVVSSLQAYNMTATFPSGRPVWEAVLATYKGPGPLLP